MEPFEAEQKAISICQKIQNHIYIYHGAVKEWDGLEGTFSIIHDENCCGATQNVLFCFSYADDSILLTALSFLDFYNECSLKKI